MAIKPKKIPELSRITSIGDDDLFIIEQVSGNTSSTFAITGSNLRKSIILGPYDTDSAANTAGVSVGEPYYTSSGSVKVRLT